MSDDPFAGPVRSYDQPFVYPPVPPIPLEDRITGTPDEHWLVKLFKPLDIMIALQYLMDHPKLICTGALADTLRHQWPGTGYTQYSLIGWLVKDLAQVQREEQIDAQLCPHNHYWGVNERDRDTGVIIGEPLAIWPLIQLSRALANWAYGVQYAATPVEEVEEARTYLERVKATLFATEHVTLNVALYSADGP